MSDNHYAPPKSRIDDLEPPQPSFARPGQIVTAIRLAAVNYLLGLVVLLATWDYFAKLQSIGSTVFGQVLGLILIVWLYYKIYLGRNWARMTLLVLSALGGLVMLSRGVMNLVTTAPTVAKAHMVLSLGLNLAILWLLFISPGRHWFRRAGSA